VTTRDVGQARTALRALADPEKAAFLAGYFKTGKGQYGEGDRFLGIGVPSVRKLAKQFNALDPQDCCLLLQSVYNEERLLALLILVAHFSKGDIATRDRVFRVYLDNRVRINNWNLVDSSAPYIVGPYLQKRDRGVLYQLMASKSLWDRRIAILATFAFIRANDFVDTLKLVEQSFADPQDLMHKACGWMLREIGKRDQTTLEVFLHRHLITMPRTMLRYAIEKFEPARRKAYLVGEV
jgi:3-methyladenine DNA glycosylase AlkD